MIPCDRSLALFCPFFLRSSLSHSLTHSLMHWHFITLANIHTHTTTWSHRSTAGDLIAMVRQFFKDRVLLVCPPTCGMAVISSIRPHNTVKTTPRQFHVFFFAWTVHAVVIDKSLAVLWLFSWEIVSSIHLIFMSLLLNSDKVVALDNNPTIKLILNLPLR